MKDAEQKRFDCVEMKRRAQEQILRETEGMTREQELEYWRRIERDMQQRIESAREQRRAS